MGEGAGDRLAMGGRSLQELLTADVGGRFLLVPSHATIFSLSLGAVIDSRNSTLSMTNVHTLSQKRYARSFSALKFILFLAFVLRVLLMTLSKVAITLSASALLNTSSSKKSFSVCWRAWPTVVLRYS
ncbi:hypothetical protein PFISCL1PPCAC_11280 [Pristionchus fissidentatus]|uniref:G protein-coupled receptor n=1 Tax=Pristionchus fissidentatus TaxID=1538716 RepID=A0AAV5VKS9_9BILA|nr:hypothetical protein PFISCL1PPCAC_11280 [Pristionchus fissidentatus]